MSSGTQPNERDSETEMFTGPFSILAHSSLKPLREKTSSGATQRESTNF